MLERCCKCFGWHSFRNWTKVIFNELKKILAFFHKNCAFISHRKLMEKFKYGYLKITNMEKKFIDNIFIDNIQWIISWKLISKLLASTWKMMNLYKQKHSLIVLHCSR
jgi:hypothetical protein